MNNFSLTWGSEPSLPARISRPSTLYRAPIDRLRHPWEQGATRLPPTNIRYYNGKLLLRRRLEHGPPVCLIASELQLWYLSATRKPICGASTTTANRYSTFKNCARNLKASSTGQPAYGEHKRIHRVYARLSRISPAHQAPARTAATHGFANSELGLVGGLCRRPRLDRAQKMTLLSIHYQNRLKLPYLQLHFTLIMVPRFLQAPKSSPLTMAACTSLCGVLALWGATVDLLAPNTSDRPSTIRRSISHTSEGTNLDMGQVARLNLFGKAEKGAQKNFAELPTTNLNLKLTGIIANVKSGQSRCFISQDGKPAKAYFIGDILDRNIKVHTIARDFIVLERDSLLEKMVLNIPFQMPPPRRQLAAEPVAPPAPPAALPEPSAVASKSLKSRIDTIRKRRL